MVIQKEALFFQLIKRIFLVPSLLLLAGGMFSALTLVNIYYPDSPWQKYVMIGAGLGNFIIVLAIAWFIYKFFVVLCIEYEKWLSNRNRTVASLIVSIIRRGFRIIFFLVVIQIIISFLGLSEFYLKAARKSIDVILIGSVGWIFLQILNTTEAYFYHYSRSAESPNIHRRKGLYTKVHLIRNALTVVIIVFTLAAMLMVFDNVRSLGVSLLASAGFLTAILGLAAQRTLSSMFAGIHLALSQPIKIDDVILIDDQVGTIEEITLSYVTVKLSNLHRMVIPINHFIDKPFQNLSRVHTHLIGKVLLYVDYLLPVTVLRRQLDNILKESSFWDQKTATLQVSNMSENTVEITIQVSAENYEQLSLLRAEVLEKLLEYMRDHYSACFPQKRVGVKNI